ncbi:MAG: dihydrodipicolinate synthase family protein [Planctomycetia bacterium]|nr:dihydrodipicolinate synthase family protein [Planctomycetia bacterium]
MKKPAGLSRRDAFKTMMVGAAGIAAGNFLPHSGMAEEVASSEIIGDPRVRGPFPILSTPYTDSGEVDYEVLGKAAQFVDWCGSPGMIWPQSGDSVDLLTMDEKLQGMEVLTDALKGRKSALCLGVQGKDTEEMLVYARHAAKLAPPAIISRPPDDGKTEDDMRQYWKALAKEVECPVIIQTTGGTTYKGPAPSVPLLIELGKEFPHFGYVKEEAGNTVARMREELAAKPAIKRVFSAAGGWGWLHQTRIGTEGVITERAAYADLLARLWNLADKKDWVGAADTYSKLLLMINLRNTIGGNEMRSFHLYVWMKRGVFKNLGSRHYPPKDSSQKWTYSEMKLSQEERDEIDARFEAIKPYLREGNFA